MVFSADCNSASPVQTKINSGSINERNSSISVALVMLKNNHPVYPITRATDIDELRSLIDPEFILVCTGEAELQSALNTIPSEIAAPAFFRALILSSALPEPPLITAPA
jgi:hypothetical protein